MSDAATTPAPPRAPAGKGASRACFKCGKTGHWSKDCTAPREEWIPQRPYGEAGVPQSPTDVGGEGEGDPKPATATKKKSTRKPKFTTVDHLLGPHGVSHVSDTIPERFAAIAKGPGHEFGDFARLVGLYREWTRKMYPHAPHEDVMRKVKTLAKTREVRATVREFKEKERIALGGDPADENENEPPRDEDEDEDEHADVFFPDDDDEGEEDGGDPSGAAGATARDEEEEEAEWNDAMNAGFPDEDEEGADEDELAALMEREERDGDGGDAKRAKEATRAAEGNEARARANAASVSREEEARAAAFDAARAEERVNFDESSEDDDEFEVSRPATGRRSVSAAGALERGKARKKVKAPKRKRRGGEKGAEAAAAEAAEGPEPAAGDAPEETTRARKKLGGGGRRNRAAADDDDDDEEEEEEEGAAAAAVRRPRRKVVADLGDDSDDEDEPLPASMGGDAHEFAGAAATNARPGFLFEEDDE